MFGFLIIGVITMLVSLFISNRLKSKFEHYSQLRLQNNLSGAEIAAKMLADHGIRDVKIVQVDGQLTDHYNPIDKTVNLSESVYHQRNAAADSASVQFIVELAWRG
jgi:Zn-dependent membrane protease YugP